MTAKEALEKITNLAVTYSQIDADTCELLTTAKEALEKQIPKKVIWKPSGDGLPLAYCSVCGKPVIFSDCCFSCGQKLEF